MPLETKILLCLSTGHIDEETARCLDALVGVPLPIEAHHRADTWQARIVAERWQQYGWFVWVLSPSCSDMPPSLGACLRVAAQVGADWIQFDRDCAPVAELPAYDW